ncbi:tRNA/rRNA methyltransferase SpoU [Galbibacter marinus]|uniref:tRNA/rRNA methyltransferase SpoU n=1 Tax=Galbibacter marinus TaxID=555500 RepID=K2PS30_9FLAO|nr:TrmH family RNA methyltransferase [Galbibacter marinus]EKF55335.1 tRNA/rRNA methyltransferase SpoU [Galbibacter marinus]
MIQHQLEHNNTGFTQKQHPIILICDQLTGAANIGSIFRLADGFGIQKIYFLGPEVEINRRIEKTSRSTHKFIDYEFVDHMDQIDFEQDHKKRNCIALEITDTSKPIQNLTLQTDLPTYLIIGNENYGISQRLLNLVDQSYHIYMYGKNSSMNIAQATGIALYEITNLYVTV